MWNWYEPSALLWRSRLVNDILALDGLVLITSAAGSGKSVLAEQIRSMAGDRTIIDNAPDNLATVPQPDSILFSRSEFEVGDEATAKVPISHFSTADLWFTIDEIEALLELVGGAHPTNPAIAEALRVNTGGWPAAVHAVARLLVHRPSARRQIERVSVKGPHLASVVDPLLSGIAEDCRDELGGYANLPVLLPEFFEALSCGHDLNRLRRSGLPFAEDLDGRIVLPKGVRERLKRGHSLPHQRALRCGLTMVDEVGPVDAIGALMAAGASDAAVQVAVGSENLVRNERDLEFFHRLKLLADECEVCAEFLLLVASLAFNLALFTDFDRYMARCLIAADERSDHLTRLRAEIVSLTCRAKRGNGPATEDELEDLQHRQQLHGDGRSEAELQELRFVSASHRLDSSSRALALRLGEAAAMAFKALGQRQRAAQILRQVALGPALDLGRYQLLMELDKRAAVLLEESTATPRSLVFRALAASLAGDLRVHQKAIDDLGRSSGPALTGWPEAYLWVSRMIISSYSSDVVGVGYAYQRYRESIGELLKGPTGVLWESFAVHSFSLVGEAARARAILDSLESSRHLDPASVGMAELVYQARVGDPAVTSDLRRGLLDEDLLSIETTWRADLECLVAKIRQGEDVSAELEDVISEAGRFGLATLARTLAGTVKQLVGDTGERKASRSIHVLGPFRVVVDGIEVDLPKGRPVELLKMLALRGGTVHVEAVIDTLWPDSDLTTGRRRIKNVINRARALLGADALLRRGDLLFLDGSVSIDVADFRQQVSAAMTAPPGSPPFVRAAVAALDLARRQLLPGDLFADWIAEDRWQIESTAHRLVEDLTGLNDDGPPTDWLVDVANDLGILDESLFVSLARRAVVNDSGASARRALQAAERVALKLDVDFDPPRDLVHLA